MLYAINNPTAVYSNLFQVVELVPVFFNFTCVVVVISVNRKCSSHRDDNKNTCKVL